MALWEMSLTDCDTCDKSSCKSVKRILTMMEVYQQWLSSELNKNNNSITDTLQKSFASYSTNKIIDDYTHIQSYKYKMSSCPQSTECISWKRHKRDNYNDNLYFTNDVKEIIAQKMLDQIHLYLYHPISNNKNKRFGTIYNQDAEKKQNEDVEIETISEMKCDDADIEKNAYSFGQQFFYWDYYKQHRWFISKKYENLKEELLNNVMCKLDPIQWNIECENAVDKKKNDKRIKSLRSNDEFEVKYQIKSNISITMNHLLSILFYCNTNDLQNVFSSTYRRLKNVNETDEEFKQRHGYYYHFAKLLRETVEVYGNVFVDEQLSLYHGIDRPLYFTQTIAKFYGPTSTSKNQMIAAQFAGGDGMILEFGKHERNAFYFDCFLSGYDREQEYLFLGGYAALKIKNILHFIGDTNKLENYSKHLELMECFISMLSNKTIEHEFASMNANDIGILSKLILNKKHKISKDARIPHYISQLFDFRCNKMSRLEIDLMELKTVSKIINIDDVIMNTNNDMVDINLLCKIFLYLGELTIILPNNFAFSADIIQYLYYSLSSQGVRQLFAFHKIEFYYQSRVIPYSVRDRMTAELQFDFDNIGWTMSIEKNEDDFESIFLMKINADNNSNHHPLSAALSIEPLYLLNKQKKNNDLTQVLLKSDIKPRRKNSIKELQLRIVREPLQMHTVNKFANCCLCCKDLMDPLDKEERVIKLTCGFIRQYAEYQIPAVIYELCLEYVGKAERFDLEQLQSPNENKMIFRRTRKCTMDVVCELCGCYGCGNLCVESCNGLKVCFRETSPWIMLCVLFAMLCFVAKDIAGLVIYSDDDCNKAMNGVDINISFSVSGWILGASISHMCFWILLLCAAVFATANEYEDIMHYMIPGWYLCAWLFFVAWTVIGFLFYSKMDGKNTDSNKECKNLVLSWCILQSTEAVLPICAAFIIYLLSQLNW